MQKVKSESEVAQSCLTLRDPTDRSLPGSSVHAIFQAKVLEWGAIAFSDTALTYSFSYLEQVCCSMTSSNCCFLTCTQVSQEAGLTFPSLSEFSTVDCDPHSKGFGIVNKGEIDVFLELSCFLHDPVDVGNLISGSSAFSKTSFNIWKFTIHVLLKPSLENIEHYFASM